MANLSGSVSIDSIDLWDGFKTGIRFNKTELLKFAPRKTGIEYNWQGENGIEIDTSNPVFDAKTITLQCFTICDTRTEFLQMRDDLIAQLMLPGHRTLRLAAHGMDRFYNVDYKDCQTYAAVIPLQDDDGSLRNAHTFTLILVEPIPQLHNVSYRITDEAGNYLVT